MGEAYRWQDAPNAQDAPVLRLYERYDASGPGELSADLRLSEFVVLYYKPVHLITHDARPRHVEAVEESVRYWVRFTGDPPLSAIRVWDTARFVQGLKGRPGRNGAGMSNNTIRKHCGAIQAILDLCGQADRWNREAVGLLEQVPYIARPRKEDKPAEDCFTLDEYVRLVENCDAARLPLKLAGRPIAPGRYHRALLGLIFNTGLRIGGAMGATWRNYHGDWLWLPPRDVAKGFAGKRVELNAAAQAILESLRGFDCERIFAWPTWPQSKQSLYKQLDRITACLPPDRRFAFHGGRKLHNNQLAAINGLACMKSLGHTSGRTTVEHYTSRTVVADALAKMPALPTARQTQRRLFD